MDNLKSLLFVIPATEVGGAEIKFFQIMKHMPAVQSILLSHKPVTEYFSELGGVSYSFDDFGCQEPMSFSLLKTIRYANAIAQTVQKEKPECVVGVLHTGCFYASAARDIFRFRPPVIGTIEGPVTAYFKKEKRSPSLLEKILLRYLLSRPSSIAVPSEGVKNDLVQSFHCSEKKISVVLNGVDINGVRTMAREPLHASDPFSGKTIVTACRLNAEKDFSTLLKAFSLIRERETSRLIIIGDGVLRDDIIRESKTLGIDRDVTITGFLKNPFPWYVRADVFVLSSFFEGFGNVIVEAMALGIPVVATDCPSGPREIIQDRVNGFLVPMKDPRKMAEGILDVLKDEALRTRFINNGKERANRFLITDTVVGFEKQILKIMQKGGRDGGL